MSAAKKSAAKAAALRRALIVWGGWDGHASRACAELFGGWLQGAGFQVEISDSLDAFTRPESMAGLDVVVPMWTMGALSPEQWKGLKAAVLAGTGVAGFHGGMGDAFRQHTEYQFMTGGQFVAHPGNKIRYTVEIVDCADPVTRGLAGFSIETEQYYMHVDPSNKVLATTTFSGRRGDCPWIRGTVMPVVWKRRFGKGRVFYSAIGHGPEDFAVPEALEIQKRGILWAARAPVKAAYTSPAR